MSQFWSLHDSVLSAALWEIKPVSIHVWVCCVWRAVRVVLHVELRAVREACSRIFGVLCRVRRLARLLLGLERRGGRLVIPAQMDITQARQSGAARGGGGGRGWGGGGGGGGGVVVGGGGGDGASLSSPPSHTSPACQPAATAPCSSSSSSPGWSGPDSPSAALLLLWHGAGRPELPSLHVQYI